MSALMEVYGLLTACIPQRGHTCFDNQSQRKRQGIIPDYRVTVQWCGQGPSRDLLSKISTTASARTLQEMPDGVEQLLLVRQA